jgi:hypothetical protein
VKVIAYMRVAQGARGPKVDASAKPNSNPLMDGKGYPLQTAHFAIKLDVPHALFETPVIAEIEIEPDVPTPQKMTVAAMVSGYPDVLPHEWSKNGD